MEALISIENGPEVIKPKDALEVVILKAINLIVIQEAADKPKDEHLLEVVSLVRC